MAGGWRQGKGWLPPAPRHTQVGAIAVGLMDGEPLLDLDYLEDSNAGVDANVVMLGTGQLVEVQSTAEGEPFSRQQLNAMIDLAETGIEALFASQRDALAAWREQVR